MNNQRKWQNKLPKRTLKNPKVLFKSATPNGQKHVFFASTFFLRHDDTTARLTSQRSRVQLRDIVNTASERVDVRTRTRARTMNLTRSLFHAETCVMTHALQDNSHTHHMFNIVRTSLSPRGGTCHVTLHLSMLTHGTARTLLTRRQRSDTALPWLRWSVAVRAGCCTACCGDAGGGAGVGLGDVTG